MTTRSACSALFVTGLWLLASCEGRVAGGDPHDGGGSPDAGVDAIADLGAPDVAPDAAPQCPTGSPVWTQRLPTNSPGARASVGMVFDSLGERVVLFGGIVGNTTMPGAGTWVWSGETWTELTPATSPPARAEPAMAYDPSCDRIVMFGGITLFAGMPGSVFVNDTWEFDGTTWWQASPGSQSPAGPGCTFTSSPSDPDPRFEASMAFDPHRGRVVMFGGGTCPDGRFDDFNDVWEYDCASHQWFSRPVASGGPVPAGRRLAAMGFHEGSDTMVVSGGGVTEYDEVDETWLLDWDGNDVVWTAGPVGPSARMGAGLVYDAARDLLVLYGGVGTHGSPIWPEDTWEWDGTAWSEHVVDGPPPRYVHGMAWDAASCEVVLFGGIFDPGGAGMPLDQTWTLGVP